MTNRLFVQVAALVGMVVCGSGATLGCSSSDGKALGAGDGGSEGGVGGGTGGVGGGGADGGSVGDAGGGGSTGNPTGNPTGSCGDAGADECPAYTACVQTKCTAEAQACTGSDGKSGACSGYTACARGCNCDDTCLASCQRTAECDACLKTYTNCLTSACSTELNACVASQFDGGDPFDGSLGSHTCKDLQACCATSSDAEECNSVVGYGSDLACSASFSSFGCK